MKVKRRTMKRGRVEVIPMIDTILILLIFYMSFSTFNKNEKRMDAKLPVMSKAVAPNKQMLDILLKVKDRSSIVVNGSAPMDMESLLGYMKTIGNTGQEGTVVIEAEPTTKYQDVVGALDACAQAGLKKVAFRPLAEKKAG